MSTILQHGFAWICGQYPLHTWASSGVPLPCCQRCTGLYLGSLAAIVLHFAFRPALTPRFLKVHGAFLAMMVPFGLHWIPQGPLLRCWSGMLFGFGVATFLRLGTASTRSDVGDAVADPLPIAFCGVRPVLGRSNVKRRKTLGRLPAGGRASVVATGGGRTPLKPTEALRQSRQRLPNTRRAVLYSIGVAFSLAGATMLDQEMAPATLQVVSFLSACGAAVLLTLALVNFRVALRWLLFRNASSGSGCNGQLARCSGLPGRPLGEPNESSS